MAIIEVGRVCIKKQGREAAKKVVVVAVEKGYAVVEGINVKRRKCNARHLFPTAEKLGIKANAESAEIIKLLKK